MVHPQCVQPSGMSTSETFLSRCQGVCNFLHSVSSQQKFEVMDGPAIQPLDGPVLQLHVTTQFYFKSNGNIHPQGMRACLPKGLQEKRGPRPSFGSSFYMFFLLPLGLPYGSWASQECCFFYLRSSLRSLDLPLFYFPRLFPSFSFSHCHSAHLFPILTT